MDDDGSGGLRCYWEHSLTRMPAKYIDEAHDYMVRAIGAGIERPTITLGELMDLPLLSDGIGTSRVHGGVKRPRRLFSRDARRRADNDGRRGALVGHRRG
jgi:hypothetical protein